MVQTRYGLGLDVPAGQSLRLRVLELCLQIPCLSIRIGTIFKPQPQKLRSWSPAAAGAVRGLIAKFDNQL